MKPLSSAILLSFIIILLHTTCCRSVAQEAGGIYTAHAYWLEEQNQVYQNILLKKKKEETLNPGEEQYYNDYHEYLKNYFSRLTMEEKERYFEFKSQWDDEKSEKTEEDDTDVTEITRAGIKPGRKFLLSNGLYGVGYGLVLDYVFDIEAPLAAAVPILGAGVGLLIPLANTKRYEGINFGTVLLARHGKFIGVLHGAALGLVLSGDPDENDNSGKIIAGSAMLGSITLGETGFQLGKKNNWSEGRISTYRYYSLIGPGLSFAGLIASNVDNARAYGGATLLAGGLSYLYADLIYKKYHFSRGDILAASSFGILSTAFGFGLVDVSDRWEILVPAATLIGGTLANHALLRNTQLTSKEGWNVNYVTGAVSLIGFGIATLIDPDEHYAYFLLPSSMGMLGWIAMTSRMKNNSSVNSRDKREKWTKANLNLTPHNYFVNKQINTSSNNTRYTALPMFSFQLHF